MTKHKITPAGIHILRQLAFGNNRVFYMTDRPNGWVHLERAGFAVRKDETQAELTEAGRRFLVSLGTEKAAE